MLEAKKKRLLAKRLKQFETQKRLAEERRIQQEERRCAFTSVMAFRSKVRVSPDLLGSAGSTWRGCRRSGTRRRRCTARSSRTSCRRSATRPRSGSTGRTQPRCAVLNMAV